MHYLKPVLRLAFLVQGAVLHDESRFDKSAEDYPEEGLSYTPLSLLVQF